MVFEIEKRSSTSHELKAFESFASRGILLFRQNYQENDLIVDLILERGLRLSALVRGGQKSIKRFGGKLEPLKLLNFQLRSPKGLSSFEKLFSLEATDVVEVFDEYKKTWNSLNEGLFYTEFFRDLFPRGDLEPWMYQNALKSLVAGNHLCLEAGEDWRRLYVWFYFSSQLGFGLLGDKGLFARLFSEEQHTEWSALFTETLFSDKAVKFLEGQCGKVLEKKILRDLYSDWMQRSHLKCKSLESWAML
ncbi:MAG: DNA repair protein RecO [Bdellovibrionota bacterium]